ncbi:MAG: thrombospondin type 3 repeat-containing protein [Luteolibacter sp.]|uniref:thrombospondin type 3 repeat-containing protein n=1 Tax=Luteolibacter sp. TaxID=1962973 RepID=UPI0032644924
MKSPFYWLAAGLLSLSCDAAQIGGESFDYASASPLGSQGGGSGWSGAWFQDGESTVTGAVGLGFTDSLGNVLNASGLSADTSGTATTRSLRDLSSGQLNNVWISFLYQLPAANSNFEGVSFYRGAQPSFSVHNPGSTTTAAIYLTSNLTGGASVNTSRGTFGQTHFVALKLTKAGGTGGADRVEVFIDPDLTGNPASPAATINGSNFDFDRVRIAGQNGSKLLVDELRVGVTFADVAPHSAVAGNDSDNDGLTDSQEAVLGLDPNVSDAVLIAGIKTHPDWFDLYTADGMIGLGNNGVMLSQNSDDPVNLIFEVQQSDNLTQWGTLETYNRQVELPAGKNFLRVTLQDR